MSEADLSTADGRPLHAYQVDAVRIRELRSALMLRLTSGKTRPKTAAAFVLWASEHIRARFAGGALTWEFVFDGLGLRPDYSLATHLVETGLRWWGREVRVSEHGRMFLYTLMAEGGLPQAVLADEGRYRRAVLGLVSEIEAEQLQAAPQVVERLAARWVAVLPLAFQGREFERLLADLALALVNLRMGLPADLPAGAIRAWLDRNSPGWEKGLPLRLSPEIAEALILPALSASHGPVAGATGPAAVRELRRDETRCWHGWLRLRSDSWLPEALLPDAAGQRLRLLPAGTNLHYSAEPEAGGWRLRRFGGTGPVGVPRAPCDPVVLGAFADGRPRGEVVLDPGLPAPEEAVSLWRSAEPDVSETADRLIYHPGSAVTRNSCIWLLGPIDAIPVISDGLSVTGQEPAPGGWLWRMAGAGELSLAGRRMTIRTGAESDAVEARLYAYGPAIRGWRLPGGGPVYHGALQFFGEIGPLGLRRLPSTAVRLAPARALGASIAEWIDGGATHARLRVVCLAKGARFDLRETGPARVELKVSGLADGWRLTLRGGTSETHAEIDGGAAAVSLAVAGVPPGQVFLHLFDPSSGSALDMVATWPARSGMIVDPAGARLNRNAALAADALAGWRAIIPEGVRGDLELRLVGQPPMAVSVAGEVSLMAHLPLLRSMLAQGGPDATVNLQIDAGQAGPRLEIRRYTDEPLLKGGILDCSSCQDLVARRQVDAADGAPRPGLQLYAVDLSEPTRSLEVEAADPCDLAEVLGQEPAVWLIQGKKEGQTFRAVVWTKDVPPPSTRKARIAQYVAEWQRLAADPQHEGWRTCWLRIAAVTAGGDAGVLDQVQALGQVPDAVIALAMRVTRGALPDVLALDTVAPFFWPVLPVGAFVTAVRTELARQRELLATAFDDRKEIEMLAKEALAKRIGAIVTLRPELAGHFDVALRGNGLPRIALADHAEGGIIVLQTADPVARLTDMQIETARCFDRLPTGNPLRPPHHRPVAREFSTYVQPLVDAPIVAAEIALGLRPAATVAETLALINLRLVDPDYFDAALPAALATLPSETSP